jgi:hypothetical protein
MSESYTIQELGGLELARHYPDIGPLSDASSHTSVLSTDPQVIGFLGWLRSFRHCTSFWATLSANADGLRLAVAMDDFAVFIPWSEATVTARRGSPATVVRLRTPAMPSLDLVFNLDDEAADAFFRGIIPPLPRRDPPQHLFWWRDRPWIAGFVAAAALAVGLILSSILLKK